MSELAKVLLWGTGSVCEEILNNGINCEIMGFIESRKSKEKYREKEVFDLDNLPNNYDYIIVANKSVNAIYEVCTQKKIALDKVIFLFPIKKEYGFNNQVIIKDILGDKNYTNYCLKFGCIENSFFYQDLLLYKELNKRENFSVDDGNLWPVISDKYANAGTVRNYFWQDLWAAQLVISSGEREHFDIGSRLDGFIAHLLSAKIDVTMIDVRPFPTEIQGLHTIVDDAKTLHQIEDSSIKSLSALCSIEHFGLGRYGDSIDPEACFECFNNISRVLRKGGSLYLSLPVGKERVEFNAHRVFYPSTIIDCFDDMELIEFSSTADGKIEYNVGTHDFDNDSHNGEYRYGLFHFKKK